MPQVSSIALQLFFLRQDLLFLKLINSVRLSDPPPQCSNNTNPLIHQAFNVNATNCHADFLIMSQLPYQLSRNKVFINIQAYVKNATYVEILRGLNHIKDSQNFR